jgi:hypothetical protein
MKKWMLADLALGMSIAVAAYTRNHRMRARLQAPLQQQPVARHRRARMRAGRTTQAATTGTTGTEAVRRKVVPAQSDDQQPTRRATCGRTRTGNAGGSTTSAQAASHTALTRGANRDTRSKTPDSRRARG